MNPILRSRAFVAVFCFVLGALSVLGLQNLWPKPMKLALNDAGALPGEPEDPFAQMRQMQKRMMQQMTNGFGGPGLGGGFQVNTGEVSRREDDRFVYYDISIRGLNPEKLKVRVEGDQIVIEGRAESSPANSANGDEGTFFTSSFHRSFPVPEEVDAAKLQMEQDKQRLTLKFPKSKA